jgi:hypothetical protein
MAAAAILNFRRYAYLTQGINTSWHEAFVEKIASELLQPCGSYWHFSKFKMAAAAILDF